MSLRLFFLGAIAVASVAVPNASAAIKRTSLFPLDTTGYEVSTDRGVVVLGYSNDSGHLDPQGQPIDRRLRISVDGGPLVMAQASKPLSLWAEPHVGTDRKGRTVVVYPTCADRLILQCDLRQFDVRAGTDVPLSAVNTASGEEVEGVMDRGALLFAREDPQAGRGAPDRKLYYRPVGGPRRTVTGYWGSNGMIDLDRGRILVGEDADEPDRCGKDIRLARVAQPGLLRPIAGPRCSAATDVTTAVELHGDFAYWLRWRKDGKGSVIQRRSLFGGAVQQVAIAGSPLWRIAVESSTSVLALETDPAPALVRLSGLRWTKAASTR